MLLAQKPAQLLTRYPAARGRASWTIAQLVQPATTQKATFIATGQRQSISPSSTAPPCLRQSVSKARPFPCRYFSSATHHAPAPPSQTTRWTPPLDAASRPVIVLGAGVIGRRLALMWASTGRAVVLQDIDSDALSSASTYIADTLSVLCAERGGTHPGRVHTTLSLADACSAHPPPWMVVEAVPENRELKVEILGAVDGLVPDDCLIASNSSTFPTSHLRAAVSKPHRLLNTHYYVPPRNTYVELMTCGATQDNIFPFLAAQMREVGLAPLVLPRESQGFVFHRIWAAAKQETLKVLAEDLATPQDVDALFRDFFHAEKGPCEKMDEIGLHTVLAVEKNVLHMHAGDGQREALGQDPEYVRWLEREYVSKHKLGEKTGDGLFSEEERLALAKQRWGERRAMARRVMDGESVGA